MVHTVSVGNRIATLMVMPVFRNCRNCDTNDIATLMVVTMLNNAKSFKNNSRNKDGKSMIPRNIYFSLSRRDTCAIVSFIPP